MVNGHDLCLFSGTANRPLAEAIGRELGIPLSNCKTTKLPDGEIHVEVADCVRERDVFILQSCSSPVNDNLMELLLYVDALRRASAHTITAVIPYFPYSRQERMASGREAISAKVVATVLEALGTSRVVMMTYTPPHCRASSTCLLTPCRQHLHWLSTSCTRATRMLPSSLRTWDEPRWLGSTLSFWAFPWW